MGPSLKCDACLKYCCTHYEKCICHTRFAIDHVTAHNTDPEAFMPPVGLGLSLCFGNPALLTRTSINSHLADNYSVVARVGLFKYSILR